MKSCTRVHVLVLMIAALLPVVGMAADAKPIHRFDFCDDPSRRCMSGRGYTVCEAYLKHLNAMPRDGSANACTAWIDPKRSDFTRPDWKDLDVMAHLDWIYLMKRGWYNSHPPRPSFDEWKALFTGRIARGEITPRLKLATIPMGKAAKLEQIVAFDEGDARLTGCKGEMPTEKSQGGGFLMWQLTGDATKPINEIVGLDLRQELLQYKGKPYFIWQTNSSSQWFIGLSKIDDRLPLSSSQGAVFDYEYAGHPICDFTDRKFKEQEQSK